MRAVRILLAGIFLMSLAGCGTAHNLHQNEPAIYGGLVWDFEQIPLGFPKCDLGALAVFDIPFSLVFDTVTLPYTVLRALLRP